MFSELVSLRTEILRIPLELEFSVSDFDQEYLSFHLGCFDEGGGLIGCLVLKPLSHELVKMRQVAVSPIAQSKGVGTFMVQESEVLASSLGFKRIELSARTTAVEFYDKLLYQHIGDTYQEVGILHQKMSKDI